MQSFKGDLIIEKILKKYLFQNAVYKIVMGPAAFCAGILIIRVKQSPDYKDIKKLTG